MSLFYTYVIRDPRNFEPIYVGKGCNGRIFKHWENMLCGRPCKGVKLYNKLTSIFRAGYDAPIYEKLLECEDEKACFLVERFFINSIGRENLCNATDGGEGSSGYIASEGTRQKIRIAKTGTTQSAEARQKNRDAKLGHTLSEEHRQKLSVARRGKKNCNPHSEEARKNISEGWIIRRQTPVSQETRKKLREAQAKRPPISEETRRKLSEWQRGEKSFMFGRCGIKHPLYGRPCSAETRQKISESQKRRYVRRREEEAPCGVV